MNTADTTKTAAAAFQNARREGRTVEEALEASWQAVRGSFPRRRARSGIEAIGPLNTSGRRNYRSPLGEELGIPGAAECYGQHSAKWPRTVASLRERKEVVAALAAFMESVEL